MKYDVVQQSLEEWFQNTWSEPVAVQYDDVPFNADLYDEFIQFHVAFGLGKARSVEKGCYRQLGQLIVTVYTKPSQAQNRRLELANIISMLMTKTIVRPVSPLVAPVVNLDVPDFFGDPKEQNGWVRAQLSCPFYYDTEF